MLSVDSLRMSFSFNWSCGMSLQVKWKPPYAGALYYLRGKAGVEVHTGDELLEHYFETEEPRKHASVVVSWTTGNDVNSKMLGWPADCTTKTRRTKS